MRLSAGDGNATIEDVLPRTSALIRKASGEDRPQLLAANVETEPLVTFNEPPLIVSAPAPSAAALPRFSTPAFRVVPPL